MMILDLLRAALEFLRVTPQKPRVRIVVAEVVDGSGQTGHTGGELPDRWQKYEQIIVNRGAQQG